MYSVAKFSIVFVLVAFFFQLVLLGTGLLLLLSIPATVIGTLVILIVFLSFYSMQVFLDREYLRISYGLGLMSRLVPLQAIHSCEIVPNNYLTWIYDPSLEHVLRLNLREGGKVIVGIGDARRMMDLINSSVRQN